MSIPQASLRDEIPKDKGNAVLRCFDFVQDRELVERLVEWQLGVFRQLPHYFKVLFSLYCKKIIEEKFPSG